MTDIDPDTSPKPIQVNESPVPAQIGTALRDLALVLSVVPALLAVLGTRDLQQIIAFIQSTQFAPALGVIVTAGVFVYRQWLARRTNAEKVTMEAYVPDRIATTKK